MHDLRQLIRRELEATLDCLTDEFALTEQGQKLRGQAIVHVRKALLLLTGSHVNEISTDGAE